MANMVIEWGKTSDLAVTGAGAYNGLLTTVAIAGQSVGSTGYNTWMSRLQTLERFNGRPFATPAAGATSVSINLFNERLVFLSQAWDSLRQSVYDGLLLPAMNGSGRVRSLQESASLSPVLTTLLYENEIRRRA